MIVVKTVVMIVVKTVVTRQHQFNFGMCGVAPAVKGLEVSLLLSLLLSLLPIQFRHVRSCARSKRPRSSGCAPCCFISKCRKKNKKKEKEKEKRSSGCVPCCFISKCRKKKERERGGGGCQGRERYLLLGCGQPGEDSIARFPHTPRPRPRHIVNVDWKMLVGFSLV